MWSGGRTEKTCLWNTSMSLLLLLSQAYKGLKHPSSWKLPTCMTLEVLRETKGSVLCIGLMLRKQQVSG